MNWWRTPIIVLFIASTLWLIGHVIPSGLEANPPLPLPQFPLEGKQIVKSIDKKQIELDKPVISEEELLSVLERKVLPLKVSRKENKVTFLFGKGLPLYSHLAQTQDILNKNNCPIVDGEEVKSHRELVIEYRCSSRRTGYLRLTQTSKSHQMFSQLAVVLIIDTALDISLLNQLNQTSFPFTLMVNPFKLKEGADYDLNRLYNKEIIVRMPMEPSGYPYTNPGPQTLLINHKTDQIHSRLDKALKRLPTAKGLVPFYGDRAVNHPNLMHDLFEYLDRKKISYLDVHPTGKPDRRGWCHQVGIKCFDSKFPKKGKKPTDLIINAVGNAKKNGGNILLLNADTSIVKFIEEKTEAWAEEGLELVLFSELAEKENNQ